MTRVFYSDAGATAVEAALRADLVLFQPEGTISDSNDVCEILNLLSLPLLARTRRIPVFVLNGTFPLYADSRFTLIKTFLDLCHYTALRDRLSAEHYEVKFMPDTAVLWPDTAPATNSDGASRPYVLITTGAQCPTAMNIALATEALAFCEKVHLKPLIMSKQRRRLASLRREFDRLGGHVVETASLQQASQWLSECRIHIGGRYHMALFCLAHRIPSVLVPVNTHKNRWLSEEFPGISLVESVGKVGEAAAALYEHVDELVPRMTAGLNRAKSLAHQEMAYAASLARDMLSHGPKPPGVPPDALAELQRQIRLVDVVKQVVSPPDIRWRRLFRRHRERPA